MDYVIHTGLNHKDYEHPFDKKALEALEATPGIERISKLVVKNTIERVYTIQYTGSNIKVTETNYPELLLMLHKACSILDVEQIPDLYIQWGYSINSFTTGVEKPFIVINSGAIDLCNEQELMFVLGHEVGHIKSMHLLYHMMAQGYNAIASLIADVTLGLGKLLTTPIRIALYYWYRMSEFSADRAGLLCCQDKMAAINTMIKMAGAPVTYHNRVVYESFIEQATDFKRLDYDGLNKLVKAISLTDETHPWTVMRAAELLIWIKEGHYTKIIEQQKE